MTALRALILGLALAALPATAEELRGPRLAAASNFGQGAQPGTLAAALALGATDFRDAVYWRLVDDGAGRFTFDGPTMLFPRDLDTAGAGMSLTVNNGHPAYDGGATPHSPTAVAGYARHAARRVTAFPAIHSVEVGNEFNSANFVSGPVREAGLQDRPACYMALLKATHDAAKAKNPEIRILGGGVHSIPVGYLDRLFALGAADYMDALALHPHTTPPEQLVRQVDVLGRLPAEGLTLSMTRPLLISGPGPVRLGQEVTLAPQTILADSYHQFAYPGPGGREDGFERFARFKGREIPLVTRPGQEREGTFWTPYLGLAEDHGVRMNAEVLLPGMRDGAPVEIVHRYRASAAGGVALSAEIAPLPRSADGVRVGLVVNGVTLEEQVVTAVQRLHRDNLMLAPGDSVELAVGPNGSAEGDVTAYRITIRRAGG